MKAARCVMGWIMMMAVPALQAVTLGQARTVAVKVEADSEAGGYESYRAMDGDAGTLCVLPSCTHSCRKVITT